MKNWWKNSVVYQVYPASYQDSNGDGIGDLPGITKRLDYIKKLGVDIVWLSPIYKSPQIDNGYDIADYRAINPDFGNMEDFDELLNKAHKLGLKIMMDLVVNHTSDEHKWFQESRKGKDNPYRDYYIWRDGKDDKAPNNWGSFFTGPAWKYDDQTGQYYMHLFAPQQPDLNWENPNVRHSVYDMMNWWADKGIDGFRMDVINYISKPNGLPDAKKASDELYANPEPLVANGHRIHEFLQEMNKNVMSNHNMVTVGEAPAVTTEEAKKYSNLSGKELNMVFQFEHMGLDGNKNPALGHWSDRKATLTDLRANLTKWQTALAGEAWNSLYWNNHDQPRVVSRYGNDSTEEYRVLSAKMLATILHFQQGTPFIFEGEEIGMTNANFKSLDDYVDLDSINSYHQIVDEQHLLDGPTMLKYLGIHSRDNARTPMQWDDTENAGFSTGKTWEHLNHNYKQINVKKDLANHDSIFYYYQKLIKLRHEMPIITDGIYALVDGNDKDPDVYAYTRKSQDGTLLIIANYTDKELQREYDIPDNAKEIISNYSNDQGDKIRPYEAKVYQF
ncbi:alpha-glucosidase [Companilactobacillus allii]|uniref:alpha-glucosidase n=1 Tax=Companilactobacillus allii TaxID=1847728 RepID=UPI000E751636|nr:alpha-glucosidase [Companilactobacillus allii]USQ68501.1 alpha-glucosidase [Companilactobacillus allii]